ncbi:hypothetical protein [Peribacillus simplex]|uniref:YhfM-like domain-containing protein n=1 Tax=Peribacillus simplex TaxID=1478 RepID=A0A9W4LBM3_9BACI|nr:hypothetical protein [Peribacillus simplex]WHX92971.1 hypothetical protein QNH50_09055 [Peribacillus simplex]CAH0317668.1 hypothetical protein SRABI133_05211 [Peribacillus simplex]
MRKIINFTFLFAFMLLLVGCMGEDTGQLTRVDVQKNDAEEKYEEALMITDNESIELLSEAFKQIKWDNRMVKIARKPDLKATLFYTFDENMPARLVEYEIWFNESGTATIISNNENKSYGELDKESAKTLINILLKHPLVQ